MPLDQLPQSDPYGGVGGREYVYPISQDILYNPRTGAESGATPYLGPRDAYGRPIYGPWPLPEPDASPVVIEGEYESEDDLREVLPGSGAEYDVVYDEPVRVLCADMPPVLRDIYCPVPSPSARDPLYGEQDMAEWGTILGGLVSTAGSAYISSQLGPASPPPGNVIPTIAGGMTSSADLVRQGFCPPPRRRRRRRLLTPTDLADLASLKTITGGGQALNFAVLKAVRR